MKILRNMSVKRAINLIVLATIFVLVINFFIMHRITEIQEKHNRIINIAGRQRMLTQKITKGILLMNYDEYSREKLLNTVNRFENNLKNLKYGENKKNLPPTENETIMEQQRTVTSIWNEFKKRVKIVTSDNTTIQEQEKAIRYIRRNNIKLLQEVDKAVKLYEEDSMRTIVLSVQITILIIIMFIIFVTWIIVNNVIKVSENDQLTNIYNRKKFMKEAEKEIARVQRHELKLGLIMFDIDNFKEVNDNYGHDRGDEVLKKIAEIAERTIRGSDIFARWGGDEFMILAPHTNLDSAIELAHRLREEITQYKFKKITTITCSFGVTEFKKDDNIDNVIKRVDNALYEAKEQGKNQVMKEDTFD